MHLHGGSTLRSLLTDSHYCRIDAACYSVTTMGLYGTTRVAFPRESTISLSCFGQGIRNNSKRLDLHYGVKNYRVLLNSDFYRYQKPRVRLYPRPSCKEFYYTEKRRKALPRCRKVLASESCLNRGPFFPSRERRRDPGRLHFRRVKRTFPSCAFLYIFHGTTHPDTDGIKAPA